jgi:hypothetical protein
MMSIFHGQDGDYAETVRWNLDTVMRLTMEHIYNSGPLRLQ